MKNIFYVDFGIVINELFVSESRDLFCLCRGRNI